MKLTPDCPLVEELEGQVVHRRGVDVEEGAESPRDDLDDVSHGEALWRFVTRSKVFIFKFSTLLFVRRLNADLLRHKRLRTSATIFQYHEMNPFRVDLATGQNVRFKSLRMKCSCSTKLLSIHASFLPVSNSIKIFRKYFSPLLHVNESCTFSLGKPSCEIMYFRDEIYFLCALTNGPAYCCV